MSNVYIKRSRRLPKKASDCKTKKHHKSILKNRIWISSRGDEVIFLKNNKEVCKLLENEKKIIASCHIQMFYFTEFLSWRIKEIDENRK